MISDAVLLRYSHVHPAYVKHRDPLQRHLWEFMKSCGLQESNHESTGINDCEAVMKRIKQEIAFLEATAEHESADVKFAALQMADGSGYRKGGKKPILINSHYLRMKAKALVTRSDIGYAVADFDYNGNQIKEFVKCFRILLRAFEAASTDKCWVFDLKSTEPGSDDFSGALLKCLLNGVARPGHETKDTLLTKLKYTMLWSRDDLMTYLLERMSKNIKDQHKNNTFDEAILFALQNNKGLDENGIRGGGTGGVRTQRVELGGRDGERGSLCFCPAPHIMRCFAAVLSARELSERLRESRTRKTCLNWLFDTVSEADSFVGILAQCVRCMRCWSEEQG